MSRESQADMTGRKLTRDERTALRTADLADCPAERRAEIRAAALKAIAHLEASHKRQLTNGLPVTADTLARNTACHRLTLECLAALESR